MCRLCFFELYGDHRDLPGRTHSFPPRRSADLDGAGAELDRERDRARLRELVAVQPQGEAVRLAGLEIAARLVDVEGPALEEDVGRLGELRSLREHRSEEHTSELQSLVRIQYALFCLKKKKDGRRLEDRH